MRKIVLLLALLLLSVFSFSQATAESPPEESTEQLLQQGKTWYQLALAKEIDSYSLRQAQQLYERVLKNDPSPTEKTAAEAGLVQTEGRLENSDEMFRNVWPGSWKLIGDHSVYEKYDSHVELALDRAWGRVVDQMEFKDQPRLPVFPRCTGDESCEILRDMVILAANENPRLRGVTDDMLGEIAGWETFSQYQGSPTGALQHQLNALIPEENLLLVDIMVHPDLITPDAVSHVALSVHLWETKRGIYQRLAFSEDVGVDATGRWWYSYLFVILAIIGTAVLSLSIKLSNTPIKSVIWGWAFVAVGLGTTTAGLEFLDGIQPAMSDLAWTPQGQPLPETWPWGIMLAGSLLLGPILLAFLTIQVVQAKTAGFISFDEVEEQYLGIPIAIGVVLQLTTHMPTMFGTDGLLDALGLLLPIATSSAVMGIVIYELLDDTNDGPNKIIGGLLAFAGGFLSIMLFLLGFSPPIYALTGLAFVIIGNVVQSFETAPEEEQQQEKTDERSIVNENELDTIIHKGSLDKPSYFDRPAAPLQKALNVYDKQIATAIIIHGSSGSGKTSYVNALLEQLQSKDAKMRILTSENSLLEDDSDTGNPYATLIDLLGDMFKFEKLMSKQDKRDALSNIAQEFSGALELIPGVGLLMGILPEEDEGNVTNDKLIHDVEMAIRDQLKNHSLLWFIDDIQGIDQESLTILIQIVERLYQDKDQNLHSLHIIATEITAEEKEPSKLKKLQKILGDNCYQVIHLPTLSRDEIITLLSHYGIRTPRADFVDWVDSRAKIPADVMSVLQCLAVEHEDFRLSNGQVLPAPETLTKLDSLIPTELLEREQIRLNNLSNDNLLLLELAAQLGRFFDAGDLAAGMDQSRFTILRQLRYLENKAQLLIDTEEEDIFSFELEISRQVLINQNKRRQIARDASRFLPSLTCEFHGNVAQHLNQMRLEKQLIPSERIVYHAELAGSRHRNLLQQHIIESAEEAAKLFAWERALKWVDKAKSLSLKNPEFLARLTLVEAIANNGFAGPGEKGNQQIATALACYRSLFDNAYVDQRHCLLQWVHIHYVNKGRDGYLNALLQETPPLLTKTWSQPFIAESISYYQILARFDIAHPSQPSDADWRNLIDDLTALRNTLSAATPTSRKDVQYQENLLARIENKLGDSFAKIKTLTSAEKKLAVQHFDKSILLKEKLGDKEGLAYTYGAMARYYRDQQSDYQRAIELFEKDIVINKQIGGRKFEGKLLNDLGGSLYLEAMAKGKDHSLLEKALHNVSESLSLSIARQDTFGSLFAAGAVIHYSCELQKTLSDMQQAIDICGDQELYLKLPERPRGWAKGAVSKFLNSALSAVEEEQIKERLTELLEQIK